MSETSQAIDFGDVQTVIDSVVAGMHQTAQSMGADSATLHKINGLKGGALSAVNIGIQNGSINKIDAAISTGIGALGAGFVALGTTSVGLIFLGGLAAGMAYDKYASDATKDALRDIADKLGDLGNPLNQPSWWPFDDPSGSDPTGGDSSGGDPGKFPFPSPPPLPTPPAAPASPLILDLDGDGIETVGFDKGIHFDHAGDGFKELSGFVGADDGLLVWDKNGDGQVNSGAELFGNETVLDDGTKADNGFLALADLDSNGDGVFDANDEKFSELRIFQDKNQNGQADDGELLTLSDAGVQSISLEYSNSSTVDVNGNEHRQLGSFITTSGETYSIEDVWFIRNLSDSKEALIEVPVEIAELPNAVNFGTAHSLHQAMARDETGHLQQLVQQFVGATTNEERQSLIDPIIFAWTNQGAEYSQYYQSPIDARKIGALEAFYGHDLDTPNGSGQDFATIYESIFQKVADGIYYQLAATGHLKDLFSQVNWSQNAETGTWEGNYFSVVDDFLTMVESNPEEALAKFEDFKQAVKGINAYDPVNLNLLNQSVATFIKFYKDFNFEFYSQETVDVFSLYALGATSGDDVVTANTGKLKIYGFEGNDTLNGNSDDNTLYGGKGNDYLNGGDSRAKDSDTYHFSVGDGQDTIYDYDYYQSGTDTIYIHGVTSEQLQFKTDRDQNLIIQYSENDEIKIIDFLDSKRYEIERLLLDDGTELNVSQMLALTTTGTDGGDTLFDLSSDDQIYGYGGDDTIICDKGNDVITGGTGNDTLKGGRGDDVYHFTRGDGQDTIIDYSYSNSGQDTLYLHGIVPEELLYSMSSEGDFTIHIGNEDSITIVDYLTSTKNQIENFQFDDGRLLSFIELNTKAFEGTVGNDVIYGSMNDDVIGGGQGDDTIVAAAGHNTISAGDGNDVITVGTSYSYYGNNAIDGGAGSDTITGGTGNDVITGGTGNDMLKGGRGDDVYHFTRGDGQDTIIDYSYSNSGQDTLYLHGIVPEELLYSMSSEGDFTIHIGNEDSITIVDYLTSTKNQIEQINLDDGQCLDTGVVNTMLEGFISIGSGDDAASLSLTEEQQMQFHQVILDAWEIA